MTKENAFQSVANNRYRHNGLSAVHARFVDKILQTWAIIALFAVPLSASRSLITGWKTVYSLHIFLGLGIVLLWLWRDKVSAEAKKIMICAVLFIIGVGGLFTFGIVTGGTLFMIFFNVSVGLFYPPRIFLISSALSLLFFCIAAWGYITGHFKIMPNIEEYIVSPIPWITLIFVAFPLTSSFFYAFSAFSAEIETLIKQLQQERDLIEELANYDSLTGLPVHRLATECFGNSIHRAKRNKKMVALLFIDLDNFKTVNDTYGHAAGDECLKIVSRRIMKVTRAEDTCTRIGGDEFLVILSDLPNTKVASLTAKKIITVITEPINFQNTEFAVSASIGIAIYPMDGSDMESLKRLADQSMYKAKQSGKNQYFFSGQPKRI